jgi:site-specific DNA-methyltransferase (adenine-specific)
MHDGRVVLHHADCRDVLRGLPDNSIDSVVTDPPYALVSIVKRFGKPGSAPAKGNEAYQRASAGFMGKQWDTGEVAFSEEFWAEVLRVLKPGGHVVAFSGTRTYHRMAVAIEDAGFEIRDQLGWVYGSGFPKSHNQHGDWEGWGTALKPAWEPIALARKPLCGTVAANLALWGVGALNVDGCRVGSGADHVANCARNNVSGIWREHGSVDGVRTEASPLGRWPANIVHDGSDEVLACFPTSKSPWIGNPNTGAKGGKMFGGSEQSIDSKPEYRDEGSAARFFYCAKASRADRDAGLDHLPKGNNMRVNGPRESEEAKHSTLRANTHPTVKPTSLMQWLCRLVTPPGGVVLDPFTGSGSTGKAAVLEGFKFIGCEREDEYMPIAQARIEWAIANKDKPVRKAHAAPANDNDLFSSAPAQAGAA